MPTEKIERGSRWVQVIALLLLAVIVLGQMMGWWANDPPWWLTPLLGLLALGADQRTLLKLGLAWAERKIENDK
ncbi:MAG: hypothetical protein COB08_012130 [Rhodobacteraceae bacterium]|nr:hypothetical protein [Paracoccaceae bacterium]